jgi:cytochrome b pre-mRNA-processing protein 3
MGILADSGGYLMFLNWWRRPSPPNTIDTIYGAVVAQARMPVFYGECGVPDTVEGRFDMIVLHLFLLLRRMRVPKLEKSGLSQALFDRFCADLDANLREMGVGDLTVPRRMQSFAEAFYGRSAAYERALATQDRDAGSMAIARNIFGQDSLTVGARKLSHYMFAAAAALEQTDDDAIGNGKIVFPQSVSAPELSSGGGSEAGIQ